MNRRSLGTPLSRTSHVLGTTFNIEEDTAVLMRGPYLSALHTVAEQSSFLSGGNTTRQLLGDSVLSVHPADSSLMGDGNLTSEICSQESLDALHVQFYEILELHKDRQFSFDIVKDFCSVCESFRHSQVGGTKTEKWLFEENVTWRLLQILMEDRLRGDPPEEDVEMNEMDVPVSEKDAMLQVFQTDAVTRQCQLVVDWLENCEAGRKAYQQSVRAEQFTDKTVGWENTILQIKEKNIPYTSNYRIVSEIDPDAPIREQLPIHQLDAQDEMLFLSQILSHIRCGQLERAQSLCIHFGQAWRAATLEGWRLYHNPNVDRTSKLSRNEGVLMPTEGNPNRDIWKLASWRLADDARMPSSARTIYAALCGNLEAILMNMETWHDWLWAHLKVMIDVRVEEEIRAKCSRIYVDMPLKYWSNKMNLSQVFSALAASKDPKVRLEHNKELPSVQRFLILDDMNTLYSSLASWVTKINTFKDPISGLLIRFAAHLVLALRSIGKEETEACMKYANEVLRVYTKFIVTLENPTLVMFYIAKLPVADQVPTLAQYLETIVDPGKKFECLELAETQGLDMKAAAQSVVESIRSKSGKISKDLNRGITEEDLSKINALDWLVVYPSQYSEALWQANAVVRQFIALGKLDAAREAFQKLPPSLLASMLREELANYPDLEDFEENLPPKHRTSVREHLSLKIYLDAQLSFSSWFKFYFGTRPKEPEPLAKTPTFQQKLLREENVKNYQQDLARWQKRMGDLAKEARSRLFNVLLFPGKGWLGCGEDLEEEGHPEFTMRRRELENLCRLCIPEVSLLIHQLSVQSGQPQGSIELTDVIASERYALYRFFSKEKLRELLEKVTEACSDLLAMKKDPWGLAVTS